LHLLYSENILAMHGPMNVKLNVKSINLLTITVLTHVDEALSLNVNE